MPHHVHSQSIILASASPRRTELLRVAGVAHEIKPAHIDEQHQAGESPHDYVLRMACEKAAAVAAAQPASLVLAADTIVVINNRILGKPRDRLQAVRFLRLLSGRVHQVMTAVALSAPGSDAGQPDGLVQTSQVTFRTLTDRQISRYVATDEPLDKAGAYAIQGLGAVLVRHLSGSFSGIMGLPLAETMDLLHRHGWR